MSKRFRKQSHTIYECKYHLVFCPKYRYRVLTDEVRQYTRESIEKLVKQKEELEIIELNVQADHVHLFVFAVIFMVTLNKTSLRLTRTYE